MKYLKNTLCIILAAVIAFSASGLAAMAADPKLPEGASYVSGDADGNAIVNSADALGVINYAVDSSYKFYRAMGDETAAVAENKNTVRKLAADVSNDSVINSSDALYILNFKVRNISSFPRPDYNLKKVAGNIQIDPWTGLVVDAQGVGLVGYGYDMESKVFFATGEGFQREFGYAETYDVAAVIATMPLDTTRIYFEYAGKDWMVQLWKGFYGFVFAGCEVGLYNRPHTTNDSTGYNVVPLEYYQDFTIKFYYTNYNTPDFTRSTRTWWFTAFNLALHINPKDNIPKMKVDCTMRFNDAGLYQAFLGGLEKVDHIVANYTDEAKKNRAFSFSKGSNYWENGNNTVEFIWQ